MTVFRNASGVKRGFRVGSAERRAVWGAKRTSARFALLFANDTFTLYFSVFRAHEKFGVRVAYEEEEKSRAVS